MAGPLEGDTRWPGAVEALHPQRGRGTLARRGPAPRAGHGRGVRRAVARRRGVAAEQRAAKMLSATVAPSTVVGLYRLLVAIFLGRDVGHLQPLVAGPRRPRQGGG